MLKKTLWVASSLFLNNILYAQYPKLDLTPIQSVIFEAHQNGYAVCDGRIYNNQSKTIQIVQEPCDCAAEGMMFHIFYDGIKVKTCKNGIEEGLVKEDEKEVTSVDVLARLSDEELLEFSKNNMVGRCKLVEGSLLRKKYRPDRFEEVGNWDKYLGKASDELNANNNKQTNEIDEISKALKIAVLNGDCGELNSSNSFFGYFGANYITLKILSRLNLGFESLLKSGLSAKNLVTLGVLPKNLSFNVEKGELEGISDYGISSSDFKKLIPLIALLDHKNISSLPESDKFKLLINMGYILWQIEKMFQPETIQKETKKYFKANELLSAGSEHMRFKYPADLVRRYGYTLKDLFESKIPLSQYIDQLYPNELQELKKYYTTDEILQSSDQLYTFKRVGLGLSDLKKKFPLWILRTTYSFDELAMHYSLEEMREEFRLYTLIQKRDLFKLRLVDLRRKGVIHLSILDNFHVGDLGREEIREAFTNKELIGYFNGRQDGFNKLNRLLSVKELREGNYPLQFILGNYYVVPATLLSDLKKFYPTSEFVEYYSNLSKNMPKRMKDLGFSIKELSDAGVSRTQLIEAGFSVSEIELSLGLEH